MVPFGAVDASAAVYYSMGDIDADGQITAADARHAMRYAANLITLSGKALERADMNFDGVVDAADARLILRILAGLDSHKFKMDHYYDKGYEVRLANTPFNTNPNTYISGHQTAVKNAYESIYPSLTISSSVNTPPYTSSADICKNNYVTLSNLTAPCTHFPDHLTNAGLRLNFLIGTNKESRYLWTGHFLTGNPMSNAVEFPLDSVMMLSSEIYENNGTVKPLNTITRNSRYVLFHETGHQLYAPDHYCYGKQPIVNLCTNFDCVICYKKKNPPPECAMYYRWYLDEHDAVDLLCIDCKTDIYNHLNQHHKF